MGDRMDGHPTFIQHPSPFWPVHDRPFRQPRLVDQPLQSAGVRRSAPLDDSQAENASSILVARSTVCAGRVVAL